MAKRGPKPKAMTHTCRAEFIGRTMIVAFTEVSVRMSGGNKWLDEDGDVYHVGSGMPIRKYKQLDGAYSGGDWRLLIDTMKEIENVLA